MKVGLLVNPSSTPISTVRESYNQASHQFPLFPQLEGQPSDLYSAVLAWWAGIGTKARLSLLRK